MVQMQATCSCAVSWCDLNGNTFSPKAIAKKCGYSIALSGAIPFRDQTPAGTEIDLPFTGIVSGASVICVENKTGQELNMAWGGNWMPHLAADGLLIWAMPAAPAAGVITGLRFMLTQLQQGDGLLLYTVMGN